MSAAGSADLDLPRKLNLIEAMLNADGKEPLARRLDNQVTFSHLAEAQGYLTIERNDLWLAFEGEATRVRVTDFHVSEIVALIHEHRSRE